MAVDRAIGCARPKSAGLDKKNLKTAMVSATALAASLATPPALAQVAEATVDDNVIIVTAQRRAEALEDVPMAIAVVQSETLDKNNITNIHDLGRVASGVQINFGGVSTQPAIRGVTSLTNGLGNENNVAIYVDGFYVSDNQSINADLANLASVEVLKGPQGTLYGRNATGGAILFNTLNPTQEMSGKFQASYGSFNEVRTSGYVSGPITDKILFMAAAAYRKNDGWIELTDPRDNTRRIDDAAPQKQASVRTKLQLNPTENFTATLAYNYSYSSDPSGVLFTTFDHLPASIIAVGNARACCFGTASYNYDAAATARSNQATLTMELETGIGTLTSRTGYDWRRYRTAFDFDGTYADFTYNDTESKTRAFQQSLDYTIDAIQDVDLVIGGLYYYDRYSYYNGGSRNYGPGKVLASVSDRPLKTKAWALYADATWHATDKLSIGFGGRYSSDHKFVEQTLYNGAGVVTVPFFELDQKFNRFTPRATVRYEVADQTNIYASWSKGFRSGAYNATAAALPSLSQAIKPEDINAFEVGFKTAQSNFRFEIAGYYYDFKNLHVSLTIPAPAPLPPNSVVTVLDNAPKAEVYGIDGQFVWSPLDRLNLTVGAAWIHGRYKDFSAARGTGLAANNTNIGGQSQNWNGQQMARAPNFSGNAAVDYTVDVGGGELQFAGNVSWTSSFVISNPSLFGPLAPAEIANKQRYRQGSYALVNASIDWTDPSGHFTLGVWGKNLTDHSYRLTYNGGNFGDYSTEAAPASYGVRFGFKY